MCCCSCWITSSRWSTCCVTQSSVLISMTVIERSALLTASFTSSCLRATVPFLVVSVLFLHQTSLGEKDFPVLQHFVSLRVLLVLVSKPGWLILFLPVLVEGELRLYQLSGGVGLAHLPTLVLPVQWRLRGWTEGPVVPLRVQSQFYHTSLLAWLLVSLLFPVKHHSGLL
jgi:hypothetical protein